MFELLQHLRGNVCRSLIEGTRKSTREMIEEQEAVRGRLFTIQDVMQSTIRAWLQVCTQKQKKLFVIFNSQTNHVIHFLPWLI